MVTSDVFNSEFEFKFLYPVGHARKKTGSMVFSLFSYHAYSVQFRIVKFIIKIVRSYHTRSKLANDTRTTRESKCFVLNFHAFVGYKYWDIELKNHKRQKQMKNKIYKFLYSNYDQNVSIPRGPLYKFEEIQNLFQSNCIIPPFNIYFNCRDWICGKLLIQYYVVCSELPFIHIKVGYSVMPSDRNSCYGVVVLDTVNMA